MFTAYIDDSGQTDPPVFLLAGFIARTETWAEFSRFWQSVLDTPPRLRYFKMKEASTLSGEFRGWTETKRDERVLAFAELSRAYVSAGLSAVVFHEEYSKFMGGVVNKFLDHPYLFIFHNVIFSAIKWQINNGLETPIDFVFDEQLRTSDVILGKFGGIFLSDDRPDFAKHRIKSMPRFADDKKELPLQAADLLAWHIRRNFYEQSRGFIFDSPAYRILKSIPHEQTFLSEQRLIGAVESLLKIKAETDILFPYDADFIFANGDKLVTEHNGRLIFEAKPSQTISLASMPAKGMKRFLLIHRCPNDRTPHLHRRSGNLCLSASVSNVRDV